MLIFPGISMPDHTRRRCDHAYGVLFLYMTGLEKGKFPGSGAGPRLQVCTRFN